ncbi:MAG: ATP-binding protein [Pseudomonadota bacterium]
MKRQRGLIVIALIAACGIAFVFPAYFWASDYYQKRAQASGQSTLALVAGAVDQTIGRFRPIAGLIAGDPDLQDMLRQDAATGFAPFMNEKLRQIAISVDASEIYVLDRAGLTVATSNYRDEDSFLGRNYAYRPYFTQAIAGRNAFFHALGTASGERGFFFSAPILDGIEVLGVLAVKVTVDEIELDWEGIGHDVVIADGDGIVFLTSREDYRFRALVPPSDAVLKRIADTQQFPLGRVQQLELSANVIDLQSVQVVMGDPAQADRYLATSTPLSLAGWHATVFTALGPIQVQVFRTMALGILALIAVLLVGLVIAQRRANILQRIRTEAEQRALLEVKVRERTADLDAANTSLREEVAERRKAEERLRKSQKELVQAGKLAALGQMSAAISHEINQPLAAIKSYADNAAKFLARSRTQEAESNVRSISKMSDRMAEISRHLRNFARQPGDTLSAIDVTEVITETIGLVGPQTRALNAEIWFVPTPTDLWALGGKLRLQQVLVNIVTNALEAMEGKARPVIEIQAREKEGSVRISIRDHGAGLPQDSIDQVFDAFYTTKDAGVGMGLGMSISYNIVSDFGGTLTAANHPDGGAVFTVTLIAAERAAA